MPMQSRTLTLRSALREHWPEYLCEGWGLGCLMICTGIFVTVLESPQSILYDLFPGPLSRSAALGLCLGATLTLLIYSPWGRRSGAHLNPAVTLGFLRLGE